MIAVLLGSTRSNAKLIGIVPGTTGASSYLPPPRKTQHCPPAPSTVQFKLGGQVTKSCERLSVINKARCEIHHLIDDGVRNLIF